MRVGDFWQHVLKGPGGNRSKCRLGKHTTSRQDAGPHPGQAHVGLRVRAGAEKEPETMDNASGMSIFYISCDALSPQDSTQFNFSLPRVAQHQTLRRPCQVRTASDTVSSHSLELQAVRACAGAWMHMKSQFCLLHLRRLVGKAHCSCTSNGLREHYNPFTLFVRVRHCRFMVRRVQGGCAMPVQEVPLLKSWTRPLLGCQLTIM